MWKRKLKEMCPLLNTLENPCDRPNSLIRIRLRFTTTRHTFREFKQVWTLTFILNFDPPLDTKSTIFKIMLSVLTNNVILLISLT